MRIWQEANESKDSPFRDSTSKPAKARRWACRGRGGEIKKKKKRNKKPKQKMVCPTDDCFCSVDFTYCPRYSCCGKQICFKPIVSSESTQACTGALVYAWDFGDCSARSTEKEPCHVYCKPGIYVVTLTVTCPSGATTTVVGVKSKYVVVYASFMNSLFWILMFLLFVFLLALIIWMVFFRR